MMLEEIEKRLHQRAEACQLSQDISPAGIQDIGWLISRVRELEEGIRKHRRYMTGSSQCHPVDEALYKLLLPE